MYAAAAATAAVAACAADVPPAPPAAAACCGRAQSFAGTSERLGCDSSVGSCEASRTGAHGRGAAIRPRSGCTIVHGAVRTPQRLRSAMARPKEHMRRVRFGTTTILPIDRDPSKLPLNPRSSCEELRYDGTRCCTCAGPTAALPRADSHHGTGRATCSAGPGNLHELPQRSGGRTHLNPSTRTNNDIEDDASLMNTNTQGTTTTRVRQDVTTERIHIHTDGYLLASGGQECRNGRSSILRRALAADNLELRVATCHLSHE
jgi:hypothetical protein